MHRFTLFLRQETLLRLRICGLAAGIAFAPAFISASETAPARAQLLPSPEAGWPQFRGLRRDGISDERGLLQTWPENGPKLLWSADEIGRGFSSPIIAGGRIFITGDVGEELRLFALDLQGKPLWQATNGASWKDPYPGSRASAAVVGGMVYLQNAHGRLACYDAESGREIWALNLLERFKGRNITWALSEGVLVDDRAVYATAGGAEALAVALDRKTGDLLWKSEPLRDTAGERAIESPSYVSPILLQFAGRRLLIGCSLNHLYCIDADSGRQQWAKRMPTRYSVLAMMPVLVGDAVFMTAPHGSPGKLVRLLPPKTPDATVGMEEVWSTELDTCQGGVVHVDGKLFGSYYGPRKGWAAVDAKNGEVLYTAPGILKGAAAYADGRLYTLSEDGWMLLLEPGEKEFHERGRFRFAEASRRDAWAHPVIHEGRLYLRYHETLYCYDISGAAAAQ